MSTGRGEDKSLPEWTATLALLVTLAAGLAAQPTSGAENLRMREGISYFTDVDHGFPIIADKLEDVELPAGRPVFVFFAAAADLNCSRQARRVVDLYNKLKDTNLKFVVIDVGRPSAAAKRLLKRHYAGYIPQQLLIDRKGNVAWSHTGETELSVMLSQAQRLAVPLPSSDE